MSTVEQADYAAYEASLAAATYEADAKEAVDTGNLLKRITQTVRELKSAREFVTVAEGQLRGFQDEVRQLEEFTLPELMKEAGQELIRTEDGDTVELTETLYASIPAANLPSAISWLVDHDQGAIIKRDLSLKFGKGEDQAADTVLNMIVAAGYAPTDKQSVHPQTLAAVLREMTADGIEIPMELLGAHVRNFAKVKPPKPKK